MLNFYGTLGPACANIEILREMFELGMTGLRLNTSHGRLADAMAWVEMADKAAKSVGAEWELLIDLWGPEIRIGELADPMIMEADKVVVLMGMTDTLPSQGIENSLPSMSLNEQKKDDCKLTEALGEIPIPKMVIDAVTFGQRLLLDDGKLSLVVEDVDKERGKVLARVERGGVLHSGKSLAIDGFSLPMPTLTPIDVENIRYAGTHGVNIGCVMQPFVRSAEDLVTVRQALDAVGLTKTKIMAKIENFQGVLALPELLPYCDEVVIARGDLGTNVSLVQLPLVQKQIEDICHEAGKNYMVVTQLLDSMHHASVPTRAEVSDIAHAVFCGASSLMLTGETAVGQYPVDAMRYLVATAKAAENSCWRKK